MAKKHWIYIKRGLSEDPKHRAAMGECIWLFMHIIDQADWETGIAHDWKDEQEAADMGIPVTTLRYQRRKLEEFDYIRCHQKQRSQDIIIMEWINPREYSGGVKNPRIQGDNPLTPSEIEGDNQGDNQGRGQVNTPTLDSESTPPQRGAGISREWDMLHGHDVQPVDEEAEFMKLAIDSANMIATGRPSRYEFALRFICGVHKIPTEGQIKNWRKGIDEWMSFKPKQPKPDDVTAAILEYQGRNLTIATPYSLSNLYAIANPPNGHTPEAANIEDEEWRKQDWRKETVK